MLLLQDMPQHHITCTSSSTWDIFQPLTGWTFLCAGLPNHYVGVQGTGSDMHGQGPVPQAGHFDIGYGQEQHRMLLARAGSDPTTGIGNMPRKDAFDTQTHHARCPAGRCLACGIRRKACYTVALCHCLHHGGSGL